MKISYTAPQQISVPSTTSSQTTYPKITADTSFKNASLCSKITKLILAILLVIFTCGFILCSYRFRDLLDINLKTPGHIILQLENLTTDSLSTWDNEHLFQFSCYIHTTNRNILPLDICTPITKFNFQEVITNFLINRQMIVLGVTDFTCPPTCTPENYQRLLTDTSVFPFILWHDPSANTQEEMLQKMDKVIQSGQVGNSHWVLIIVDLRYRKLTFFDSLYKYVAGPEQIQQQLQELAGTLGSIYPEGGNTNAENSPFEVCIGSTMKVQNLGEFSCGAWCCQFLQWYMENPEFSLEDKVSQNLLQRRADLADFIQQSQHHMAQFSSLSWPS
ncbi:Ulp1 family isopeptidase [Chlamydia sp.]|uniref:Ulp1 family isopeptidase n=1 Tax=Chlamydia sp. TaxID=35827 RepID=UPI0025C08639|nr:Ulp1 family isopeptidase [Chlamydia sp.]MBQ8498484.1 Deubiquitinase and deneddylase Dub2 [Chlamydia sp.]